MKNGNIGLFDTKSGQTLTDAKIKEPGAKVDALTEYIKTQNKEGKNLFGGIVTNTDTRNYNGKWVIFEGKGKDLKVSEISKWKTLEL